MAGVETDPVAEPPNFVHNSELLGMANTPSDLSRIREAGSAVAIRRRRTRLGMSLQELSENTGLARAYLSMIENGKRRPSLEALTRIEAALGMRSSLPPELMRTHTLPPTEEVIAKIGASLAAFTEITLGSLARVAGVGLEEVRHSLRELGERIAPLGMTVIDDGTTARLGPHRRMKDALAAAIPPEEVSFTHAQLEIISIVVGFGNCPRHRIEQIRDGKDCGETLALLVSRGLLSCEPDKGAIGRPLIYGPTPKLLHAVNCDSIEELRTYMSMPTEGVAGKEVRPVDGSEEEWEWAD